MASHTQHHLSVPAKMTGCAGAADLQTAMDAYNAAVDAADGVLATQSVIDANKAVKEKMDACLLELGFDESLMP